MPAYDADQGSALADDYTFFVTDEEGVEHDVGALVLEVVRLRYRAAEGAIDEAAQDARRLGITSGDPAMQSAVAIGIGIAVGRLFGSAAQAEFFAHCSEVEQLIADTSDAARH